MLIKSAILTQASGSVGGMTASHNRGGMYFRARNVPVNPNTPEQQAVKAIMGSLVALWTNTLTADQRAAWNAYANATPITNPLGDSIQLSGQNMYIRCNTPRLQAGLLSVADAPVIFDSGNLGTIGFTTADATAQSVEVTFADAAAWSSAVGGALIVQVGRPANPSRSFFKGPFRFAGIVAGAVVPPTSPQSITSTYVFTAGQRVWIRVRATLPDARLTQAVILGPVVAETP